MTNANTLNEILEPFFTTWGDLNVKWFSDIKAQYRAEQNEYHEGYVDHMGRQRPGATEAYRALQDKWRYYLGTTWYTAVKYDSVENVEKRIRRDMKNKQKALVAKVESKVGEITEVDLHIRDGGEPNGLIVGTIGKVYVETIGAGGHNIQCYHFRTLLKNVK